MPKSDRQLLGARGERLAAAYLQQHGYTLVGANWHCPQGEIDLIARQNDVLVFVEVRTRRSGTEAAFASINPRKQRTLAQAVQLYLAEHDLTADWRVDVIAIGIPAQGSPIIEHVEDALDW